MKNETEEAEQEEEMNDETEEEEEEVADGGVERIQVSWRQM